jgi:CheY-like chemotaxis protein
MSRILIVEDEPRIASFLEKGLRANGFLTTVAADGDKAAAIAQPGDFDLVILDLGLPGRYGLQVLSAIHQRSRTLPVIILTARDGVESQRSKASSGVPTTTCASRSASRNCWPVCGRACGPPRAPIRPSWGRVTSPSTSAVAKLS